MFELEDGQEGKSWVKTYINHKRKDTTRRQRARE